MSTFHARAVRALVTAVMLSLVGCTDEPTEPMRNNVPGPSFGVGDVLTVTNTSGGTAIGSLRWVMSQIQGGEVIRFDPSLAGQTIVLDTTITTTHSKTFTIEGPADRGITISGGGKVRLFDVSLGQESDTIVFRNVTLANGYDGPTGFAAGLVARGLITAVVRFENSTLTGHSAGTSPAISGLTTILINSTVSGNTVLGATPREVLFSRYAQLVNSTVAHNTGKGVGGGPVTVRNSIISGNTGDNCLNEAYVTPEESNISDDDSCGTAFEFTIADPVLGALADNGGPSMTHALLAGSPAINSATNCSVTVDQRYAPRDASCDIGAYEFVDFTTINLGVAASATFDKNGWAVLTGSVQCSRNETFELNVMLQQIQKVANGTKDVHAHASTPIACTTTAQPWSIALVSTDGPFEVGSGTANVTTFNTRKWVTPASIAGTVKLVKARK
jgi:hypothetical protein